MEITIAEEKIVDTLVMSRLYNPQLDGGHSLSEWGKRIGFFKSSFESFNGGLTQEMLDYCIQDTLVTQKLYEHLTKEMSNDYSKESIKLEHEVAFIIAEQERNGFRFDEAKALQLLSVLKTKLDAICVEMQSIFPAKVTSGRTHKTTGRPLPDIVEDFNPGSRQQIAERLIEKRLEAEKAYPER